MLKKLIISPETLSKNYIPENILFREEVRRKITSFICNKVNTFIYGSFGSGKTTLIKSIIDKLNIKIIYIDGVLNQTVNSILKEILSQINPLSTIPKTNSSLIEKLKKYSKRNNFSICIDHFQHVKEISIIDVLLNLNLGLTLISESKKDYLKLSENAKTNITHLLEIESYTSEQVFKILKERVKIALRNNSYDESLLMKIAERSRGNVALALNLLKASAVKAEIEKKEKISEEDIPEFVDDAKLTQDERILLGILKEHKKLNGSELYKLYSKKTSSPKSPRWIRKLIQNLNAKGLVKCIGTKRWRIYEINEIQG